MYIPPLIDERLAGGAARAGAVVYGQVKSVNSVSAVVDGLRPFARLGDVVCLECLGEGEALAEIVSIEGDDCVVVGYENLDGFGASGRAVLKPGERFIFPHDGWLGRTINPFAESLDGDRLTFGSKRYALNSKAPLAIHRRFLGERVRTGYCVFDTILPICRGQRIGVFAGSGVGKSILLGELINRIECDVAVVALIGERGREVRTFVDQTMSEHGRARSTVVVATSDQSPLAKKRAATVAMSTAEKFRDDGKHVLLVFDSLTRFAEAHRETAVIAGEKSESGAFPPSTTREIAALVERAGPGPEGSGDITAIFSVLVAGSDFEEPLSDIVRGLLDGHIVLDRKHAERGRFPAIDVLKSVSRALPNAANKEENALIAQTRNIFRTYEDSELMIRAGLYEDGSDPLIDRAVRVWPLLDRFVAESYGEGMRDEQYAFRRLTEIMQKEEDSFHSDEKESSNQI